MLSWFTSDTQPNSKIGEIPQINRSLGTSSELNLLIIVQIQLKKMTKRIS
jgi:hypothetical protein